MPRSKVNGRLLYINMAKETVDCGVCGGKRLERLFDKDRYGMGLVTVICRGCGFIFTNPRPTEEAMNAFYRDTYREFYTGNPSPRRDYWDKDWVAKRRWFVDRVLPEMQKRSLVSPAVLDIGCGSGVLLNQFKKSFPKAKLYGVEPFAYYADYARKKNKADVTCGDIDAFIKARPELQGRLDVVSLYHVYEHLYGPVDKLKRIAGLLKKDGLLLIQVPNALSPNWGHAAQMCHIAHINHFSPATLERAFRSAGFEVVMTFAGPHPGNPRALTMLGRKTGSPAALPDIEPKEFDILFRSMRSLAHRETKRKGMKAQVDKGKKKIQKIREHWRRYGAYRGSKYAVKQGLLAAFKALLMPKQIAGRVYHGVREPLTWSLRRGKAARELRRVLKDQTVLIIGSGPSAAELNAVPNGIKVLTCNAGMRLFTAKGISPKTDLFLCRRKAMIEDYSDVGDLLARYKTDVLVMDEPKFILKNRELKGSYRALIGDHQKDNHYLKKLIRPKKVSDIADDPVSWTSAGVRLIQYALAFGAKEIYVIGLDLSHEGYFWGEKKKYNHSGFVIRHKHSIDHSFMKLVGEKYPHVYSLSSASPVTRYLRHKNPWQNTPSWESSPALSPDA